MILCSNDTLEMGLNFKNIYIYIILSIHYFAFSVSISNTIIITTYLLTIFCFFDVLEYYYLKRIRYGIHTTYM